MSADPDSHWILRARVGVNWHNQTFTLTLNTWSSEPEADERSNQVADHLALLFGDLLGNKDTHQQPV